MSYLCLLFDVSRTAYYRYRRGKSHNSDSKYNRPRHEIRIEFIRNSKRYGSRRIRESLKQKGIKIGRRKVAEIMRGYHDATTLFERSDMERWMFSYEGSLDKEVICHNDIAPYNITFVDDIPYGMIDFDTCCPGPRIWDIVYALYRFVPFSKEVYDMELQGYRNYEADRHKELRKSCIHAFFDTYGMECPDDLFEQMVARLQALADLIYNEANNGNEVFMKMLDDGHRTLYLDEIKFIKEHAKEWLY